MAVAILLVACVVLAGAVGALAVALRQLGAGFAAELAAVRTELARVGEANRSPGFESGASAPLSTSGPVVEEVAQRPSRNRPEQTGVPPDFVITRLGEEPEPPAPTMEAKLFADVVLRESVVRAASWAHGVRQGLSPANRNRIWFEMRREVKRARKERKAEEREAIREYRARRRTAVRHEAREESAA